MSDETAFLNGYVPPGEPVANLPATMGAPHGYTPEIAAKICEEIAKGTTMKAVAELEGFPGRSTVFRWVNENKDFRAAYAAAMEWRAESDADWLMELATDASNDYGLDDASDTVKLKPTAIDRSKLACDNLRWLMARRAPKRYGPQAIAPTVDPASADDGAPGDNARLVVPKVIDIFPNQLNAFRMAMLAND